MKILLIDDDQVLGNNLQVLLQDKGYVVDYAKSAEEGIDLVFNTEHDIILLDWMLPDKTGDEVCKILRGADIKTPIIFLTAKSQIEDKVRGLDFGADDYVTKPFVIEELLARIRTHIRRNYNKTLQTTISVGDLCINTDSCEVRVGDRVIALSPKLYAILEFLATNKQSVVSRGRMIEHLWDGEEELMSNIVDAHIKNLRKELSALMKKAEIRTIKGKGYMLCEI